ncbi:DUF3263 domain-containing protein [Microbacterium sp. NPDC089696]|uniref:DUF3263 domain-containing protein n=1 Tax=Microbacterium sp. NPDC089696 TaxID=3364199 RepID=UPI0037F3EE0F
MSPEEILAFQSQWPSHTPSKTQAIRRRFGFGEARFYQLLHRAARSAEGIAAHPVTARLVREHAALRASERSLGKQGAII